MSEDIEKNKRNENQITKSTNNNSSSALKERSKRDKTKPMTKVVIRRLPPTMTEEEFLKQIDPLPENDFYYYVEADWSLSFDATCRAYINFKNEDDIYIFKEQFDGYVFVDNKGAEYSAIVEFSPFQGFPKNRSRKNDPKASTIETDTHYTSFLQKLANEENEKSEPKLEFNLQTTKESTKITSTPLLQYLASKKQERQDDRKRRYDERRRQRDEDRQKKKIIIAQKTSIKEENKNSKEIDGKFGSQFKEKKIEKPEDKRGREEKSFDDKKNYSDRREEKKDDKKDREDYSKSRIEDKKDRNEERKDRHNERKDQYEEKKRRDDDRKDRKDDRRDHRYDDKKDYYDDGKDVRSKRRIERDQKRKERGNDRKHDKFPEKFVDANSKHEEPKKEVKKYSDLRREKLRSREMAQAKESEKFNKQMLEENKSLLQEKNYSSGEKKIANFISNKRDAELKPDVKILENRPDDATINDNVKAFFENAFKELTCKQVSNIEDSVTESNSALKNKMEEVGSQNLESELKNNEENKSMNLNKLNDNLEGFKEAEIEENCEKEKFDEKNENSEKAAHRESRSSSSANEKYEKMRDNRETRRIRNKDRPSLQIYQPGKSRFRTSTDGRSSVEPKDSTLSNPASDCESSIPRTPVEERDKSLKKKVSKYSERRISRAKDKADIDEKIKNREESNNDDKKYQHQNSTESNTSQEPAATEEPIESSKSQEFYQFEENVITDDFEVKTLEHCELQENKVFQENALPKNTYAENNKLEGSNDRYDQIKNEIEDYTTTEDHVIEEEVDKSSKELTKSVDRDFLETSEEKKVTEPFNSEFESQQIDIYLEKEENANAPRNKSESDKGNMDFNINKSIEEPTNNIESDLSIEENNEKECANLTVDQESDCIKNQEKSIE